MIWLWLIIAVFCVVEFASVAVESSFFATISVAIAVLMLQLTTSLQPISWTVENTGWAVLLFLLYFAFGAAWSVFRWMIFVHDNAVGLVERLGRERAISRAKDYKPALSENKLRLYLWIAYWPFSGLWFFISDPVVRLVKYIYTSLVEVYQHVTDWVWEKNFPVDKNSVDKSV